MSIRRHKIFPLGDNALTIEFEQEISVDINEQACYNSRLGSNKHLSPA